MPKSERAYLCNGYGCDKKCAENLTAEEWKNYPCHHTFDEKFAKNKVRRARKFAKTDDGKGSKFVEI